LTKELLGYQVLGKYSDVSERGHVLHSERPVTSVCHVPESLDSFIQITF
jgi:hypothetical protein